MTMLSTGVHHRDKQPHTHTHTYGCLANTKMCTVFFQHATLLPVCRVLTLFVVKWWLNAANAASSLCLNLHAHVCEGFASLWPLGHWSQIRDRQPRSGEHPLLSARQHRLTVLFVHLLCSVQCKQYQMVVFCPAPHHKHSAKRDCFARRTQ